MLLNFSKSLLRPNHLRSTKKVYQNLRIASVSSLSSQSYKVLVIGGGSGGISVSSNLRKHLGQGEIAIVEPSTSHYYQPLWTFVGAGIKKFSESQRQTSEVIPNGVQWIKDSVVKIEPENNLLELADGKKINYEYLVVAPGIQLKWNKIKGLEEALGHNGVCSNYSALSVEKTWEFLSNTKSGRALFTMPSTPVKCAGAPQKIAYLAEHHFRKNGVRNATSVEFYSGLGKIFAIEKYAKELNKICQERDIKFNPLHDLVEVDGKNKSATFLKLGSDEKITVPYDFLHVTPPMGAYEFVKDSTLSTPEGWVEVDKELLVNPRFSNVFSLGDASSCPTSKTAAAITAQSKVVASNLISTVKQVSGGTPLNAIKREDWERYDGYTSCPLLVGNDELILAEFSGYTGQPQETLPFDQSKPSRLNYFITSEVIPFLYWGGLLKGLWHGPSGLRQIINRK